MSSTVSRNIQFKLVFDLEYQVLYFIYQIDICRFLQHQQLYISTITCFTLKLSPTCFGLIPIVRELTPILLKLAGINYSYNAYSYQMYRLQQQKCADSFGTIKPPAHTEDGDRVSSRKVGSLDILTRLYLPEKITLNSVPKVLEPYWLIALPLNVPDLTASLLL